MELCEGEPSDTSNPNLPTAQNCDPSMPQVMLLQSDGELASQKVTFVDDIH